MTDAAKQMEGMRIGAALGAIGALPAACLVIGSDRVVPGSPLFGLAVVLIAAAYMFWNFTDTAYDLDVTGFLTAPADKNLWKISSDRFQDRTWFYGIGSLAASVAGLGGMYSTWRTPVSVELGFVVVGVVLVACAADAFTGSRRVNELVRRSYNASIRARGETEGFR